MLGFSVIGFGLFTFLIFSFYHIKSLIISIPYPAEEDNYDYPLPPCVGYVDLTGV